MGHWDGVGKNANQGGQNILKGNKKNSWMVSLVRRRTMEWWIGRGPSCEQSNLGGWARDALDSRSNVPAVSPNISRMFHRLHKDSQLCMDSG